MRQCDSEKKRFMHKIYREEEFSLWSTQHFFIIFAQNTEMIILSHLIHSGVCYRDYIYWACWVATCTPILHLNRIIANMEIDQIFSFSETENQPSQLSLGEH